MKNYNNQNDLLALVGLMDSYERLHAQKATFTTMDVDEVTRETLVNASNFVLDQIHDFLEAGLTKCQQDKEIHTKAEEAGIIIQPNQGHGLMLPNGRKN